MIRIVPTITAPVTPHGWTPERGTNHRFDWSPVEKQVLREQYLPAGLRACQRLLPARSCGAILNAARGMDLRRQRRHIFNDPSTPEIDAQIRAYYQAGGKRPRGAQAKLAAKVDRPRHWVLARARELGIVNGSLKPANWSAAELAILDDAAEDGARAIQRRLKRAGYVRSLGAILCRCRIEEVALGGNPDIYNVHQICQLMGVEGKVVQRWIGRGHIKAKRDSSDGPLPRWIIRRTDLRTFLIESPLEWEARRADHLWLIEILAGRVGLSVAQALEAP